MDKKIGNIIISSAFVGIIFVVFILFLFKSDGTVSDLESRKLAQKPLISWDALLNREYSKGYEEYINDQFPYRDRMLEGNAIVEKNLMLKNVVKNIYIADNGYFISPLYRPNAEAELKNFAQSVDNFSESIHIPVYFALAPNKSVVMKDQIPNYIKNYADEYTDFLLQNFKKVIPIDLRKTIKDHSISTQLYFYTDHHWKAQAAFYAYESIVEAIAKRDGRVGMPYSQKDFIFKENEKPFFGSEARRTTKVFATHADSVTIVEPKFNDKKLIVCYSRSCKQELYNKEILVNESIYANQYATYFNGDIPEGVVKNPNVPNGLKILILKDSYANAMIQFLSRNAQETRIVDLRHFKKMKVDYAQESIQEYIKKHNIDLVLFVHNINSVFTPDFVNFANK